MPGRAFIDTNVLVYAVDEADPAKKRLARTLLADTPELVLSAQVLGEFYVTVTRKLAVAVTPDTASELVKRLARLPCIAIDQELVQRATVASQRWQLSYWDALVLEAARQAGCERILTEDLTDGAVYDGVRIENPFVVG
ncbi:PIN domain-containing protein [Mycolicibacter sp. MYC123]|uniref:Ribonuclease VapC n=1 Tax=[Mycobacterium] zoologicum TaxID=2872311 RepID=A0ABU5YJ38_9MYCO|nr:MULTISPECIES: PIN domain-containing protein [unclassified Mycolicibacter]MEB3050056.1 PIN domain-containing protein [Mycolicibacter sp. MYC123]MEB3062420.1 PIN domain-containing protein [Mycolicibacter sp. MYC101]